MARSLSHDGKDDPEFPTPVPSRFFSLPRNQKRMPDTSNSLESNAESSLNSKKRRRGDRFKRDNNFCDDGYKWCKYGEKPRMDSVYIRSYYRCSNKGTHCTVKKIVDRHKTCPSKIKISYDGTHNHPPPSIKEVIIYRILPNNQTGKEEKEEEEDMSSTKFSWNHGGDIVRFEGSQHKMEHKSDTSFSDSSVPSVSTTGTNAQETSDIPRFSDSENPRFAATDIFVPSASSSNFLVEPNVGDTCSLVSRESRTVGAPSEAAMSRFESLRWKAPGGEIHPSWLEVNPFSAEPSFADHSDFLDSVNVPPCDASNDRSARDAGVLAEGLNNPLTHLGDPFECGDFSVAHDDISIFSFDDAPFSFSHDYFGLEQIFHPFENDINKW